MQLRTEERNWGLNGSFNLKLTEYKYSKYNINMSQLWLSLLYDFEVIIMSDDVLAQTSAGTMTTKKWLQIFR